MGPLARAAFSCPAADNGTLGLTSGRPLLKKIFAMSRDRG
jgi:hypothetical protein